MTGNEWEFHRKMAIDCYNHAWDLLDKKNRSEEDSLQMMHLAHASLYHWGPVGTPMNRPVGEWQLSRIYAGTGNPGLSLEFAKACAATCEDNGLSEIAHTADGAMARAYAVAKDHRHARRYLNIARRGLNKLTLGKEDRAVYLQQIKQTEALTQE